MHLIYDDRIFTMTIASAIRNAILCNFIAFRMSKCKSIQMHVIASHHTYVSPLYNGIISNPRTSETPSKSINSETTLSIVMGENPSGQIPIGEIIIIDIILLNLHIVMTTLLPH